MTTRSNEYLGELYDLLIQYFSLEDIQTLCFKLNIDYDSIAGTEKTSRIRELLLMLARNGRLPDLITLVQKKRPQIAWQPVPDDFQLPTSWNSTQNPSPVNQTLVSGDIVEGDRVERDKISVDNVAGGYNVIGSGSLTVNIHNELPPEPENPRLPFEPTTVEIPAGPFIMGSNDDKPEEMPQHVAELPKFSIGLYPVTNEEFAQFVWKTKRVVESVLLWNGNTPPNEILNHPVAGVTWCEAVAYCKWLTELTDRQYTLPTEAQWEKAARGENGRLFPWGNEWDQARCNADTKKITAVQAYPAQNEYGCFDMVGNVREWTATIWGTESRNPDPMFAYPWQDDRRNDLSEPSTSRRIFRGGRAKTPNDFRCSARNSYSPEKPGPKRNRHGFRVALLSVNS